MLAINGSGGEFTDGWIAYCEANGINYKIVDCYNSDIINNLRGCSGLMWHWPHHDARAQLFARQLTLALEAIKIKVFPDSNTSWHYDDKVGQKYLLESFNISVPEAYVFYDYSKAVKWSLTVKYPLVFKLRNGAGSQNVQLVSNVSQANALIKKSFRDGHRAVSRLHLFKERLWQFRRDRSLRSFLNLWKGLGRLIVPTQAEVSLPVQKGYVYFQQFVPNVDHDIRVIVIGARAFAIKRMIREGDFRASGSGRLVFDRHEIPLSCVRSAFDISRRLGFQCMAYDFLMSDNGPVLIEISYAFSVSPYRSCRGYWNQDLEWVDSEIVPESFMVQDFVHDMPAVLDKYHSSLC